MSELLAKAMKNASDSIVITDRLGNIVSVNDAFLSTFGFTEDEVIGNQIGSLASQKHDRAFYSRMWNTILNEKHWSGEIWNRRKDGEEFPTWMSVSAILDADQTTLNYLVIFTDLRIIRSSQEEALRLAYYDQLTKLPNRQKIVADLQNSHFSVCVIFNIDNFKEVNDLYGIETGDSILTQVGEWFSKMNFSPYRIGGDEFAVLLEGAFTWPDLRNRISALVALFEETVFQAMGEPLNLGMTVGVAMGEGKLLTRADIALNRAKKNKLPIALYAEHENVEALYRDNIRTSALIRTALSKGDIVCHYQPIVNLRNGEIGKYEALVRLRDEQGDLLPPALFLDVAKKTKLYPQITSEVVRQACTFFEARNEEFSVNLSDSDIRNPHIVREIIHMITATGTASRIVFEILESEGIESYDEVTDFIASVKALGAKIAIDDFGTGYSNFENIIKLNVDYIKIDGSLIKQMHLNRRHHIVVETIVSFAQKIGAQTIAEFVCCEEVYTAVRALGIDYAQGYFMGRPESPERISSSFSA